MLFSLRQYGFILWITIFCSCERSAEPLKGRIHFAQKTIAILDSASRANIKIDSLRKSVLSGTNDTSALRTLLKAGGMLQQKELQNVLSDVVSNAKLIGNNDVLYTAILSKERQFANSALIDSVDYYHEVLSDLANKNDRQDVVAESMLNIAVACEMKGNFPVSDSILLAALNFIKQNRIKNKFLKAYALYQLGVNKNIEFNNASALSYLKEAADCASLGNYNDLAGDVYFRMGECYIMESDYNNALNAYGKSVINCRRANDEMTLSSDLCAIGEIYMQKEDYKKAYTNLFESLELAKKTKYIYQQAYTYATLGALAELDSSFNNALDYLNSSNKIYSSYMEKEHQGEILLNKLNIGSVYVSMGKYDNGMSILKEVNTEVTEENEPALKAEVLSVIADCHFRKGDLRSAEEEAGKALKIAREKEIMDAIRDDYKLLYKIFEKKGQFEKALIYHKLFAGLSDSLTNKTQIKKFAELENEIKEKQLKSDHDKAEALLRSEKMQKENELKRQRITNVITGIGLMLVIIFSIFIYRSLKENKRKTKIITDQKKEVEIQKTIIEEKQKEILDSIKYAKRIQQALMPSDKYFSKHINSKR